MGDIKLFRTSGSGVSELLGSSVAVEKALQSLMEAHLDEFLGVSFLETEYSTGAAHRGRIDTLGIDENFNPVIIEYKRTTNENVINQGLFYLDWLMDHRAEFTMLAMKRLGPEVESKVDWSNPRLICIAEDYTKYDEHAIAQINRNIELLRYQRYGDEYLLLELVSSFEAPSSKATSASKASTIASKASTTATVGEYLAAASPDLRVLFDELDRFTRSLGDDVTVKELKNYFAYRRLKNFLCVEVHNQAQKVTAFVKVDPESIALQDGFTRDVRRVGHYGTGDLEITITDAESLSNAHRLIERSYAVS